MSRRPPRVIFLTGAPDSNTLETRKEVLLDDLAPAFEAFINEEELGVVVAAEPSASNAFPKWRTIAPPDLELVPVPDSFRDARVTTAAKEKHQQGAQPNFTNLANETEDFLQHSYIANQDMAEAVEACSMHDISTQHDTSMTSISTPTEQLSFMSFMTDSFVDPSVDIAMLLSRHTTTDLCTIPSAQHLTRLYPQTITVNLLAGLITISTPRTITIRPRRAGQSPRTMLIMELLLGDDTAAGFGVTFWMHPPASTSDKVESQAQQRIHAEADELRKRLLKLRRGQVVLLTNVALSTFRGKVYGQSLRRRGGVNGIGTAVFAVDEDDVSRVGNNENMRKLQRVQNWVHGFVGQLCRPAKRKHLSGDERIGFDRRVRLDDELPPDTQ